MAGTVRSAELAGPDDDDPVVRHDLDARRAQPPEQVLAAEVDLAADGVDRQAGPRRLPRPWSASAVRNVSPMSPAL